MTKTILSASLGLFALLLIVSAPLLLTQPAHAQVPDATTWGGQVASTTGLAAGYVTNTVFSGGAITFVIFILVVGVLIGLVVWGIHSIGFRNRV